MKKLVLTATLMIMSWPAASWAQLYPPNEAGVSMGAWHTIVRDVDTTRKWWELWGGKPIKIDGVDVMRFRGVFIFMVKGEPNGPSIDHFIDHIAFQTPNGFDVLKKLTDAGVRTDEINLATMRSPRWKPESDQRTWTYTYSPDGLRVEVETKEGPEWATIQESGEKDFMPGTKLNYATDTGNPEQGAVPFKTGEVKQRAKRVPRPANRGSALDFIGFEVVNLPGFVKKLEAAGVKFDEPYSTTRHKSYAGAMFTGPGGEVVELTEGLRKF